LPAWAKIPTIQWFAGSRDALAELFALADDSPAAVRAYRDLGRVLVASDGAAIVAHPQFVSGDEGGVGLKSLAVRADRQGAGIGRTLVERAAGRFCVIPAFTGSTIRCRAPGPSRQLPSIDIRALLVAVVLADPQPQGGPGRLLLTVHNVPGQLI
jgi:GNAT superfamily N-acetyltransferase